MKIPGVGPSVSRKLASEYSNVCEILGAEMDDLAACIGKKKAIMVSEFLGLDCSFHREKWNI